MGAPGAEAEEVEHVKFRSHTGFYPPKSILTQKPAALNAVAKAK